MIWHAADNLTLHHGDVREVLPSLAADSVHCVVTSPPYWGLRDYGVEGQLGLERTPEEYTAAMVGVFREVRRVLRDDGTLWLNLGDSYAGGGNYRGINDESSLSTKQRSNRGATGVCQLLGSAGKATGCKPKDLIGIPWMVAFALRADGWYLRQDIIWSKPNPMPESVTDRCTKAHEYLFLLSKSERYYFDQEAIRLPPSGISGGAVFGGIRKGDSLREQGIRVVGRECTKEDRERYASEGANRRSVWHIPTVSYHGAHFATFPPKLIEPCILAGCPKGGTVLDPFNGSGTTGMVANRFGRNYVGVELNEEYLRMTLERLRDNQLALLC